MICYPFIFQPQELFSLQVTFISHSIPQLFQTSFVVQSQLLMEMNYFPGPSYTKTPDNNKINLSHVIHHSLKSKKKRYNKQSDKLIDIFFFNRGIIIKKHHIIKMDKGSSPLKLHTPLKFWYQHYIKGEGKFQDSLLPVGTVNTVQQLWAFYQHFKRPSQLEDGSYIYLFQNHVKPVWEDQNNKKGGSFVLRFERSKSNRLWEDLILSYAVSPKEQVSDITGMRIKIRKDNAEIDFWINNSTPSRLQKCRQWILKRTDLDSSITFEFNQFFKEQ